VGNAVMTTAGIFGFPKDKCAKILVEESIKFVKGNKPASGSALEIIEFCIYDEETLEQFKLVLNAIER
ncbi:MAG: hypothetical protein WAM16_07350, partial [Nitrososphaeraceae archaeon]